MSGLIADRILHDLSELWTSLGKEQHGEGFAGVLRACSMTLVVLTDMSDDPAALGEMLAALMPEHPARTILVRVRESGEGPLDARVYSQCWMPFGKRRQICCEQVEITASDATVKDLAPVILAVSAPDLPVILWCRSGRLVPMPEFWSLAHTAQKVILDSGKLGEPQAALQRVAQAVRKGFHIGDLAWTRLTRWRETLAQVFDKDAYRALLPGITSVRIAVEPGHETSALYFRTWLEKALQAAGARPAFTIETAASPAVEIAGEGMRVELVSIDGVLSVTVNGLSQCTHLPRPSEYLAIREELGILRRDAAFEAVLP